MYKIDKKDRLILEELLKDSRQSTRDMGRKLKMPSTTVYQRIKRLVGKGVIKNFSIVVDQEKLGRPTIAIVLVKRRPQGSGKIRPEHIGQELAKLPEVEEVFIVTGEYDAIAKVRGANEREVGKWVVEKLWNMPEVDRTLTFFAFYTSKESPTSVA
ncbi:MAG: Lrp/AsnC family transcriptional regulator [Candidatus Aenigmarchaeota archaeon]|nr:Lrp/AsnC family transcriptional regulator [Candidatus Aenigmarchaeota archaeon]